MAITTGDILAIYINTSHLDKVMDISINHESENDLLIVKRRIDTDDRHYNFLVKCIGHSLDIKLEYNAKPLYKKALCTLKKINIRYPLNDCGSMIITFATKDGERFEFTES